MDGFLFGYHETCVMSQLEETSGDSVFNFFEIMPNSSFNVIITTLKCIKIDKMNAG